MNVSIDIIKEKLSECGLKITPQRIAILEAIYVLNNHPTADNIITYIRKTHPNIATGTVYKVLDTLVDSKLIKKIKTEKDIMRYDGILDQHHHLFSSESDRIEDYSDDKLDKLLEEYFKRKKIPGFKVEEIKLQINGKFLKSK
ncbi:MAG: transcriptional repressor [Chlorobi bacterium]|nr:transcriptional repressor [Chlorobiota bacterium]